MGTSVCSFLFQGVVVTLPSIVKGSSEEGLSPPL